MKLYVIGSAPQSNIQLRSQFASSYHAELLLLDNGDMLLTDRGSTNGTYLNGKKLTPDKDVVVRRGDEVVFADERLDWNRIPANTVDVTKVKEIRSIGSHQRNRILLTGDHVSRFHATMKKMADGKWYIQDHSKNGTTINGSRIPKDQDIRIKKGDKISCAGIPVANPISGPTIPWGIIGGVAAALAVVAAVVYYVMGVDYKDTVVYIQGYYHYEVYLGDDMIDRVSIDPRTDDTFSYSGTGFFISEDAKIVTNLHIAKPWLYDKEMETYINDLWKTNLKQGAYKGVIMANTVKELENAAMLELLAEKIKVVPVIDNMLVISNGKVFAADNAYTAKVISSSKNVDVDLAILQLDTEILPDNAKCVNVKKISKSEQDVQVGDKIYTVGFPAGLSLQVSGGTGDNVNEKNRVKLEPYETAGQCIRSGNNVNFEHNAMIEGGASGSPVFDNHGNVVGVISAKYGNTQYNVAIDARFIHNLLTNSVDF
jgi:pSer/pThr/pTyr-binding forkhead associated (FHA) protein/S1-C subfamily serine protease